MTPASPASARVRRLVREPRRIVPAVRRRLRSALPPATRHAAEPAFVPLTRAARIAILTRGIDLAASTGLEIGPSHNPLLRKSEGYDVRVADHLDQDGLIAKYGYRYTTRVEPVDYVLAPGRMTDSIPDRFDYIIASHVAEHTVDLVAFLQDCRTLLRPGGVLCLALPDLRYCFDRFRERTSLGRVIDVHHSAPLVHTPGMVIEHFRFNADRAGTGAWNSTSTGDYTLRYSPQIARERAEQAGAGEYVDTHNWVLTPNHFRLLVQDLRDLGYVELYERDFTDTIGHEFFVQLCAEPRPQPDRTALLQASARDLLVLDDPHFA